MSNDEGIRVVQFGLGPIGLETARAALQKVGLELVGAIDNDPEKAGRDLGELLGAETGTGLIVGADASGVLRATRPDVVLHTTSSFLESNHAELEQCLAAGAHVVSSCEELLFPFERHAELAGRLDAAAMRAGRVLLGTGVNPGFVMDTLALAVTAVCTAVRAVRAERVVDASRRRLPLQRKVGAGLTAEEFAARKARGRFGHIGLVESLRLVADGLDWDLDRVEERLEPIVAGESLQTPSFQIKRGQVRGIHHTVRGLVGDVERVALDLKMYVGAEDPHDSIRVDGDPPVDLVIRGGVFGDAATVATLINAVPLVCDAEPGLRTMKELPLPHAFAC